ncbi:hypothetical protein [Providencia phage Kokobel2]|nr:hypothetical protein [Providencia phage Kokobel2]
MYNAQSRATKNKIDLTVENNSYAIVERFGKHYAIKVKSIADNCPESHALINNQWQECNSLYTWACLHCNFVKYVNKLN